MRQDQWIDMGRTTKHYNKDTLIARKSLRNIVRKQDLICSSCLFGWNKMACQRSPQCKEKNLISPFMSSALDTCTTPFLQACGCTAGEPGTCEVQFNANAPYNQRRKSLSSKLSRAGGPFGVGGRQEAEEAKRLLDASKSKNDCNAEEGSSGAVSYAGGDCGVFALTEERERINRTIWDPRNQTKTSPSDPDPAAASAFPAEPTRPEASTPP